MLALILCSFLGMLLITSAWPKWRAPEKFSQVLAAYPVPLLLRFQPRIVARAIPAAEILLGLSLVSVTPALSRVGLLGTLLFLILLTGILTVRRARGETRVRCGCGGDLLEEESVNWLLGRNGILIVAAVVGLLSTRSTVPPPVFPALVTALALLLLMRLVESLRTTRRRLREWTVPG